MKKPSASNGENNTEGKLKYYINTFGCLSTIPKTTKLHLLHFIFRSIIKAWDEDKENKTSHANLPLIIKAIHYMT